MGIIKAIYFLIRAFLTPRLSLAAENLALRQQLAVYKQSVKRPKLRPRDRVFWVWFSQFWSDWRSALAIVQPETVVPINNSVRIPCQGVARFDAQPARD